MTKQVAYFSNILMWSLELLCDDEEDTPLLARVKRKFTKSPWQPITQLYTQDGRVDEITAYSEFSYFHPFVRRFLYGDTGNLHPAPSPIALYQRRDIDELRIFLPAPEGVIMPVSLAIKRVHLYVFDIEMAMLILEVCGQPLELVVVHDILKLINRSYPPFFTERHGTLKAGNCPEKIQFLQQGQVVIQSNFEQSTAFLQHVKQYKRAPIAAHWQALLQPLTHYTRPETISGVQYRQIETDRIPYLAFVAAEAPKAITRSDFVRLVFADGRGEHYPYSADFLKDFEAKHCYDRFWGHETSGGREMNTRILCSSYGFVFFGSAQDPFFINERDGALAHFRNHYFNMGLIVHLQRSALLLFSDRLADAIKDFNHRDMTIFHQVVRQIFESVLKFTHRYWGSEYSNQLQGRDLFNLWRKHLETDSLFNEVMREVRDINQYLDIQEQRKQSRTAVSLSLVATVGLVFTLTSSILGMNIFDVAEKLQFDTAYHTLWLSFAFSLLVIVPTAIPILRNLIYRKHWLLKVRTWLSKRNTAD